MATTDAEALLVRHVRAGDASAWRQLIERYEGRLLAFVESRLRDRAAELVRAEVHIKTWQAFWETDIAKHSAIDAAKKLDMTVGAVRVAKCRVLARLNATILSLENTQ